MVGQIPAHELGDSLPERGGGAGAREGVKGLAVGPGGVHVAGLHGQHPLDGGLVQRLFQRLDKIEQPHRLAVAYVEDAMGAELSA